LPLKITVFKYHDFYLFGLSGTRAPEIKSVILSVMFTFCKPVSSKKRFLPHRRINDKFTFTLYDSAAQIEAGWKKITGGKTIFLETEYLEIIEHGQHNRLMPRYVIVYLNKAHVGVIYFQIIDFKAGIFGDLLTSQVEKIRSTRMNLFERYIDANREEVLLRLFTCGNNLVSGAYGFLFEKQVAEKVATELVLEIIEVISKEEKLDAAISAVLIKDFHQPLEPRSLLTKKKYSDFFVEPNLILSLPPHIKDVAGYTELFSKKYRNRAKSVFKSFQGIETRYLSVAEIKKSEEALYSLYENIFERAKFKLIKLPPAYFSEVKTAFNEQFIVKGFYLDNKLIAMASCFILPDNVLEAHYIGFDYELNTTYNLYQNILYSMIHEALVNGCTIVNLGRTAAEIKTTVGAKPNDLICYIKPQNTISKIIQKPFISFLKPAEWTARNPFKEGTSASEPEEIQKQLP